MTDTENLPALPAGWCWTTLETFVDILDNQRIPINSINREERKGNIPYYGATGLVGWINDYLFDEELVLLGEDGAPFLDFYKNKAYIVKGKSWVNNHAHVLRAIDEVLLNKFLCHYLNTFDYHQYVTGTTRLKLNQSSMRKIPIIIPPLSEQHRIVQKIEELFTDLDAGIKELEKAKVQIKNYKNAVLKAAFKGILVPNDEEFEEKTGLLDLPSGWTWTTVDAVGSADEQAVLTGPFGSQLGKKDFKDKGVPLLTIGCLQDSGLSLNKAFYIEESKAKELSRYRLREGDILFSRMATVGRACYVTSSYENSVINYHLMRLRLSRELIDPLYFIYYVRGSKAVRDYLKKINHGVTREGINSSQLLKMPLMLTSIAEQHRIVSEIERRFSVIDQIEKTTDQSLIQAEKLRQSILKKAFEGKLVPQDPNDEPASFLLERIKQEKGRAESRKKPEKKTKVKAETMIKLSGKTKQAELF